jgi:putative CRISPR-associated protein (TIGR02620 family)
MPTSDVPTAIVCRHAGAVNWLRRRLPYPPALCLDHLDIRRWRSQLQACGRPVPRLVGVLPVLFAARLEAQGVACWLLHVESEPCQRGTELSADDLEELGARLYRFRFAAVEPWKSGFTRSAFSLASAITPDQGEAQAHGRALK